MAIWNLWHGCQKYSEGCLNCYVYRSDSRHDRIDSFIVRKTGDFDLPLKKDRNGEYKLKPENEPVFTCMTSDFFVEDADCWRDEAWSMIRKRQDLNFYIITKRIIRAEDHLPSDWGEGYENVTLCSTCENQRRADERLPILSRIPAKHKHIALEPLLEKVDISRWLDGSIKHVTAGGESGDNARPCDYAWILSLRDQCAAAGVDFWFKQTGANFIKDGKQYAIPRRLQHEQARKAGINLEYGH